MSDISEYGTWNPDINADGFQITQETCSEFGYEYCIAACPADALTLVDAYVNGSLNKKTLYVDLDVCIKCGLCAEVCPTQSIYVEVPGGGGGDSGNPGGGGNNGGSGNSFPPEAELDGLDNPPIDPVKFIDCFGSISNTGAQFKVSLFVQEPYPGTSYHYGRNGVGHVAIGVTKTGANGDSITQVFGFYPVGANILSEFTGPSKLVDNGRDSAHPIAFNVQMDFTVNESNFQNVLNKISTPPNTYHAFENNCVRFAYDAARAGNIDVPFRIESIVVPFMESNIVIWSYTPAGMAQEMRKLKNNGDSRVNVSNVNTIAPPSKGPC